MASSVEWKESRLVLTGRLDSEAVARAWGALGRAPEKPVVEAADLESADSAGLAFLWTLEKQHGGRVEGLRPPVADLLRRFDALPAELPITEPRKPSALEVVGQAGWSLADDLRAQIAFVGELCANLAAAARRPRTVRWSDMWATAQTAGVNALVVAGVVSFLTGIIMAFQSSVPLKQFGVDIFVVNLVALAMLRELGPIMTAVVLAGRSGSAFAAEIGTMKVNEEIDALKTMGLEPMRFLVLPRVLAGILVTPVLTIYSNLLGITGGFLVMVAQGFTFISLWNQLVASVDVSDVLTGFIKSFVFGALVAGIGCLRGLQTGKGATAVGVSTTSAVVSGIFLIVVFDAIFAMIFYVIGW